MSENIFVKDAEQTKKF